MLIRTIVVIFAAVLLSVDDAAAQRSAQRTWVIPHVLERPGRVSEAPNTTDTELHMLNLDRRATVEVALYGDDGQPMRSRSGQPVCNPCAIDFARAPKQVFSLEERIGAAGGFASGRMTGYVVITTRGSGEVNLQGFVVNSHDGGSLSLFGFTPEEVKSTIAG